MKLKLVIGLLLISMIILVSCKPVQMDLDSTSTSVEEVEISEGLDELEELEDLEAELDEISFAEFNNLEIE